MTAPNQPKNESDNYRKPGASSACCTCWVNSPPTKPLPSSNRLASSPELGRELLQQADLIANLSADILRQPEGNSPALRVTFAGLPDRSWYRCLPSLPASRCSSSTFNRMRFPKTVSPCWQRLRQSLLALRRTFLSHRLGSTTSSIASRLILDGLIWKSMIWLPSPWKNRPTWMPRCLGCSSPFRRVQLN